MARFALSLAFLTLLPFSPLAADNAHDAIVLKATSFGIAGDGKTDDGPAIQRAVSELCSQDQPAVLQFERGKIYRVRNVADIRLFRLADCQDIVIDGAGSEFLLAGDVRFALVTNSRNITIKNLSIDYDPLPFADGLIVAKDGKNQTVDVRVFDEFTLPPFGGPTREGGEQAYFGMLWTQGPYSLIGHHFYVTDLQPDDPGNVNSRAVRVHTGFKRFDLIEPGSQAISLPVRGVAHRAMDGATIRIADNENVNVENIQVWSAPWFAFQIFRNKGNLAFRHVDIRPKPDANRRTSSWRDGFHVKGNRADLLFESCHLEGMNDDAFNISTHMSRVLNVISPTELQVRQVYPLEIVPFEPDDQITFYSLAQGSLVGTAKLIWCEGNPETERTANGRPHAPVLTLHLADPIAGIQRGDRLWNDTAANPNTVIRQCKIHQSCRFQSPVTIEDCELSAFSWYHSENIEGPIPSRVVINDSILRVGRGNSRLAASFEGTIALPDRTPDTPFLPAIKHVLLQGNTIDGEIRFARIRQLELQRNQFLTPRSKLHVVDCKHVLLRDNRLGTVPINDVEQLNVQDVAIESRVIIDEPIKSPRPRP